MPHDLTRRGFLGLLGLGAVAAGLRKVLPAEPGIRYVRQRLVQLVPNGTVFVLTEQQDADGRYRPTAMREWEPA